MTFETSSAVIGALLLVLTLLVCYMALLLYRSRGEKFLARGLYRPACGSRWSGAVSGSCPGLTRGRMPLVDVPDQFGCPACSNPL